MTPAGIVLTGGRSSRMGADKALLTVGGVALAKRVADALAGGGCDPVVCQGGDVEALVALGLSARPDSNPGAGPLTAILDALTSLAPADVVVSACDLPGIDAGTIAHLLSVAAGHPTAGAVVADDHDGPHLVGVWRAATRSPLADLIDGGVRSYRAALDRLDAVFVNVPASVVVNVNRPEDLP